MKWVALRQEAKPDHFKPTRHDAIVSLLKKDKWLAFDLSGSQWCHNIEIYVVLLKHSGD